MILLFLLQSAAAPLPAVLDLPVMGAPAVAASEYLLQRDPFRARVGRSPSGHELYLDNGLLRRTWRIGAAAACVSLRNLTTDEELLRAVRPEARLVLDGQEVEIGGLDGQPNHAFLTEEWLDRMEWNPRSMRLVGVTTGAPPERLDWARRRHAAPRASWPPSGAYLRMDYALPSEGQAEVIPRLAVHYVLYDGIPALSKWITLENPSDVTLTIDRLTCEELAVVEDESWVETRGGVDMPAPRSLHVETDFAFGGFHHRNANRHVVHWRTDPLFTSQVNWARTTPCLLAVEPTYGPAQRVPAGTTFESFRTFELLQSGDRERRGLARRRMMRTVSPWVTENPLTHHLLSSDPDEVRARIDDAAEVGFEAVLLSFGSGFNMDREDPHFIQQWKAVADHAEARGIEIGSYSLFSSRHVGDEHMVVSPEGLSPTHGRCPAVTSDWGLAWLRRIRGFYQSTGFDQFENDGPYPGDVDVTPRPPLQLGVDDSRWIQWRLTADLYRHLRATGVYINAPDHYFHVGANKCGMGYREVNWSLPRAQQVIHTRQNIHDGTWTRTPSMGWMFVPLAEYHGGGAAATIEPLDEHLEHYRRMMLSNLGLGVQAHYRGPRLFDTKRVRDMVAANVAWYRRHRDILESDLVHGRRADGRDLDWMLHVNPGLETKGMLCVYNPLPRDVTKTLRVNLHYTGLEGSASVSREGEQAREVAIAGNGTALIEVTVPANGEGFWLIR